MDLIARRREVAQGLKTVEDALQRFVASLAHKSTWITVADASNDGSAARLASEAYCAIDYGMEDEVGSSVVCLGVIGASADIVERAAAVNAAKAQFMKICVPLQRVKVRVPVKDGEQQTKAIPLVRQILRNIQRSDLNLLAAYRKVPILDAPPATVTYTQAHTRSVYRKSIYEIEQMLAHVEGPTAAADRQRLLGLGRDVTHLALARPHYRNVRANIKYARLDRRGRGRVQIAAELPVIYTVGRSKDQPDVKFPEVDATPSALPAHERASSIEDQPFLHALPVYRYLT